MAASPADDRRPARAVRVAQAALVGLLVAAAVYTIHRALVLRADYFDAFGFLNNARRLAGDTGATFEENRSPLLPLFESVLLAVLRPAPGSLGRVIAPHVLGALAALFATACVWRAASAAGIGRMLALLTAVLFVYERLFVRYGAHAMGELMTTGWLALAVLLWLRVRNRGRWLGFVLVGVALAMSMLSRWTLLVAPGVILGAELIVTVVRRRVHDRRVLGAIVACAVAGATTFLVFNGVFALAGRELTPSGFIDVLEYTSGGGTGWAEEARADYLSMLVRAMSPVVLGLAAIGLAVAAIQHRERVEDDAPFIAWLAVVGGVMVLVRHSEIRYLLPALPSVAYFAARAIGAIWALRVRWARGVALAAAILAAITSVGIAIDQVRRDADPAFTTDVERAAAAWMRRERRPGARLLWQGRQHAIAPADPVLFPEDEFFNVMHFGAPIVEYYSGEHVFEVPFSGATAIDGLIRHAAPGDVMARGASRDYTTREMKTGLMPPREVELWALRDRVELTRRADGSYASGGDWLRIARTEVGRLSPSRTIGEVQLFVSRAIGGGRRFIGEETLVRGRPLALAAAQLRDSESLTLLCTRHETLRWDGQSASTSARPPPAR